MMIVIHHLGISQSERIVWLCEELGVPYQLVKHIRDPIASPESLTSLPGNKTGKSPYIEDTDTGVSLSESCAICDYIIYRHAGGKLALQPDDIHYPDYLYWYHYANGTQQPAMMTSMFLSHVPTDAPIKQAVEQRLHAMLKHTNDRLATSKWLAGPEFTAADVMSVYGLTTQRYWGPQVSLKPYPHILRWLADCASREAYKRAMEKGDPEMECLVGAEPPNVNMFEVGGTKSDHWKKKLNEGQATL
ncbi:uncharacterized protein PV09_05249 [Verruconis gallopava]|uniref:Glutathione S-transferase n=1 Tax=Verruconis gallopava TaxID=253628 RepID=A0A0D1YS87_9PEZI|nr:uncharacterized protein PV09_05249 [Verruconis gallopava]KIW03482.1 hypothetical protein PV09_05249 [Verruconis gallopava]